MGANHPVVYVPGKTSKWKLALSELLEAHYYATDLGLPAGQFAVELARLAEAGLTKNDLRWLISKGYIEPARKAGRPARRHQRRPLAAAISFARRMSVVLTEAGLEFANQVCEAPAETAPTSPSPSTGEGRGDGDSRAGTGSFCAVREAKGACPLRSETDSSPAMLPRWDPGTRTLWFGSTLVKQFKVPALNQELVLSAFAEEGWPASIDDPLPPTTGIQPKRRLHDTINRLNRGHNQPLIRFHGNGNGLAVHWQIVQTR